MSFPRYAGWLAAFALCTPAASAAAQGFGLSEIGTCAVSRGFAATGNPCHDASTIFWNPAAAIDLDGKSVNLGGSVINLRGSFQQDTTGRTFGSNIQPALVPSFFGAYRTGRASLGLGIYVPYGLTSQWKDDFPGRFAALRASLQTIYFQPNIAWQLDSNWAVGGGPVIAHSNVHLTQAIDLSQQVASVVNGTPVTFGQLGIAQQTEFGRAMLDGSGTNVGYNVALRGKYGDWTLGARYLSAITINYRHAKATFSQTPTGLTLAQNSALAATPVPLDAFLASQFTTGGPLVSQGGSSQITHPWQMQGGVGYSGFAGTSLGMDVARLGWSSFETLPVTFEGAAKSKSRQLIENYSDSWALRFGAEHTVLSAGAFKGWTGRIGYSYASSPAPDVTVTPLLPDQNRRNSSLGVAIPFGGMYKLDAGYVHVNTPGRRGRIIERASTSQDAISINTGTYQLKADVFSVALNANF